MLDDLRLTLVISRREIRDQLRDWRIVVPLVILTLFFPLLMNFTAQQLVGFVKSQGGVEIVYSRLIPFLLMVVGFFPITVSLVIALESFAGETERHSIEPLLDTPLSNWQLYLGKTLAAMFATVSASYLGTVVYLVGIYFTIHWSPSPVLLVQILILSAVQALVMVSGAVIVSTQTTSVRAANLLSSFIIVPMALLLQGESVIMFWGQYEVLWWAILGQVVIAGLLVRTGLAHFNREELLGRELDSINLRGSWLIFKKAFIGQTHSIGEWYRIEVRNTLRRLKVPTLLMIPLAALGIWVGMHLATNVPITENIRQWINVAEKGDLMREMAHAGGYVILTGSALIWLNNLKSVAIVTLLGIFSFGVVGVLGLMVTLATIGTLAGLISQAGLSPWTFVAAYFLPHGLFEIPAIILTGAAILRLGTILVTPAQGQTIGQAWLRALADWARVTIAVVTPLFLIAAIVEMLITPRIALLLLGN